MYFSVNTDMLKLSLCCKCTFWGGLILCLCYVLIACLSEGTLLQTVALNMRAVWPS